MALKKQIDNLDSVDEQFRGLYKEETIGDAKVFVLDLEGEDDIGPLKRAHERVKDELAAAKRQRDEAVALAKSKGEDLTALNESWNQKIAAKEKESQESLKQTQTALRNATKDREARELANKLSKDGSELLLPHIESRLRVELDGERAIVRVLDKDGKMSAASISDLEKELREDKKFAAVITGSRGSGSGAGSDRTPAGGAGGTGERVNPNTLPPAQLAAWVASQSAARGGRN